MQTRYTQHTSLIGANKAFVIDTSIKRRPMALLCTMVAEQNALTNIAAQPAPLTTQLASQ